MNRLLLLLVLLTGTPSFADDQPFTNIFCKSTEIRENLYQAYDENKAAFLDALNASLGSGDCVWKDYGADKKLTVLHKFNDSQVMVSAEFDGETLYAVTFNEYVN